MAKHEKIIRDIQERADQVLIWEKGAGLILDIGLFTLVLGQTSILRSLLAEDSQQIKELSTATTLDEALRILRQAGSQEFIVRGLLARAWGRVLAGAYTGIESAQEDLDEAWEIAERGPMRLFMADIHLYRARLFGGMSARASGVKYPWNNKRDGSPRGPLDDLSAAEKLITECGYHRRDEELADAKRALTPSAHE